MKRRNKEFVEEVKVEEKPKPLSTREQLLKSIRTAPDGMTLGEIYAAMPNYNPRHIRTSLQEFTAQNILSNDRKCRCHSASIYMLK